MPLAIEDDAAAWTEDEFAGHYTPSGLWFHDDPDDESDTIPVETIVPWDVDGGDDDRRRADGLHLLHLTQAEHDIIDDLIAVRVPVEGIGSRCAHTPMRLPADFAAGVCCRPSPVMGGTFLIFPGGE